MGNRHIITIANQKGGTGKTTTATILAHGLAVKGHQTMLCDLDPQGQCASALGLLQEPGVFNLLVGGQTLADVTRTTGRANLTLIPGDKRTATAQIVLNAEGFDLALIRRALQPALRNGLDKVVIDTAPSVGGLQEAALFAADLIVIPTHGHTGIRHALFGSVAEKVVRKAPCAVLSIRPDGHDPEAE